MTKENQKILYDHYTKLSKDGDTDKIRADAKLRAKDILGSFPDFANKSEKPETEKEKTARLEAEAKDKIGAAVANSGGQ